MLIAPQASLTYRHPASEGVPVLYPYRRTWHPDATWERQGVDFIDPLNAFAPTGGVQPRDMTADDWPALISYSEAYARLTVPGSPAVQWIAHHDGAAYPFGTSELTYGTRFATPGDYSPNWVMRMIRYAPPPLQGVLPMTSVRLSASLRVSEEGGLYYLDEAGEWTAGVVSLRFPFASQVYPAPVLSISLGSVSLSLSGEQVLAVGPAGQSTVTNVLQESVICEYIEDEELFPGGHILLRLSSSPREWWHVHHPCLKLTGGPMHLFCGGCRQLVNISSILYSSVYTVGEGDYNEWVFPTCWPRRFAALPNTDDWQTDVDWTLLETPADDWTVTADSMDEEAVQLSLGYRPRVRFLPSVAAMTTRPVCWLVAEAHAAEIETPVGLPAPEDTDGDMMLEGLSVNLNDSWQGAGGRAVFALDDEAPYPDWLERGLLLLELGWQDGGYGYTGASWQPQEVGEFFILPGGLVRRRAGSEGAGRPGLEVSFGDYVAAVMDNTVAVDMWQAGGMFVGTWFTAAANHLGLTPERLDIAAAVNELVIPTDAIPSRPNLGVQDGQSWRQHFDAVCATLDLRWGWREDKLFIDAGPPVYTHGETVVDLTLSDDTTTEEDMVTEVTATTGSREYRNALKASYGTENKQRAAYSLPAAGEVGVDGALLWAHTDDVSGATGADALDRLERQHREGLAVLQWTGPGRPGLRPDMFVAVDEIDGVAIAAGTVYRVRSVDFNVVPDEVELTMSVEAVQVWTPAGYGS